MINKKYAVSERDLIKLLADLELVVVSLDRIGSSSDNSEEVRLRAADFLANASMFRRFARMRRMLWNVFDSNASAQTVKKLEDRLGRVKVWRLDEAK